MIYVTFNSIFTYVKAYFSLGQSYILYYQYNNNNSYYNGIL